MRGAWQMLMSHDRPKRVLIVADDLTGAFDAAGPFAQQGCTTKVIAQPIACDVSSVLDAQIVSINTGSRHLGADEAAETVERCVRRFAGQNFDILFKKIDSTLRGNVATETMALTNVSGRRIALVAPAFPEQGRTVVNGVVHVDGVPLSRTGFAEDALSPPPLQPLEAVFAQYVGPGHVSGWRRHALLRLTDQRVVVADAETNEDLLEMLSKASQIIEKALLVGSAGLGEVLARNVVGCENRGRGALSPITDPIVFVVGSRSSRSREQVDQLNSNADTLVLNAPNGAVQAHGELHNARQVVVMAVSDAHADDADAAEVAQQLARNALRIVDDIGAGAIVVTGGDTAIAVLEAAKCILVEVGGNLLPGIPYARFGRKDRSIVLVTKAGGFGTRDTFIDIVSKLR